MKIEDIIRDVIERNVKSNQLPPITYMAGVPKIIGIEDAVTELTIEFNKLLIVAKASGKRSGCRTCKHRPKPKSKREQAQEWADFMKTIND